MARRKPGTGMHGCGIYVADQSTGESVMEGLPGNDEIGRAVGSKRSNVSLIARQSMQRLQLRLIVEHLAVALPRWEDHRLASLAVFVIDHSQESDCDAGQSMAEKLVLGDLSVDEVAAMMDNARRSKAA